MITEIDKAENDLLACATYLAEKIKNTDGHAEAISQVIPYYLANNDVDLAADLADAIEDPFLRDKLLAAVAGKCAEIGDDEYALQLVEAIEDFTFKANALEKIVLQTSIKKDFQKAFETAELFPDNSHLLSIISAHQETNAALRTIDQIEQPLTKVHCLLALAEKAKEAAHIEKALILVDEIEFDEEKLRAFDDISATFVFMSRNDRAIEVLAKALQIAENITGVRRDSALADVSINFFRAGSIDLADRTLDLIVDKHQIALTLFGFSKEYQANEEFDDSLESLDESYEMLKSQPDREVRDSNARFDLFAAIAIRFALLGKNERAIEIASQNVFEDKRNNALTQIAQVCVLQNKEDQAKQSLNLIYEEASKTIAMISLSEAYKKAGKNDEAVKLLHEAHALCQTVPQLIQRSIAFNDICKNLGSTEKSRQIAGENLNTISRILDETQRVVAIAKLGETFETLDFKIDSNEKELLARMIRKT